MTVARTLGFITDVPGYIQGKGVWVPDANRRNFLAMRERFERVIITVASVHEHRPELDSFLEWDEADLVPLPNALTTKQALLRYRGYRQAAAEVASRADVLLVRWPFALPWALRGLGKPKVLHLVANLVEVVDTSTEYRGPTRVAARLLARGIERATMRLAREPGTRLVTNGSVLAHRFHGTGSPVLPVISSCIYVSEMGKARSEAPAAVPRLLFMGYFRPPKALPVLLDAFDLARARMPLQLTLVGRADSLTHLERDIPRRIAQSPYSADIRCQGPVPFGPEVFDLYQSHDLLVLSSVSEGTPRVLVEARAFGCPVVATSVGGIPDSVEDGEDGVLAPPGNAAALADAIVRVLQDPKLYVALSKRGFQRVSQEFSMEGFADTLTRELLLVDPGAKGDAKEVPPT